MIPELLVPPLAAVLATGVPPLVAVLMPGLAFLAPVAALTIVCHAPYLAVSLGILLVLAAWDLPKDLGAHSWDRMARITPKSYVCYHTAAPPQIDGRLDDPAWRDAPWTDVFEDIEGDLRSKPTYDTRVAMRWDDSHLYVAARLEEPHVWGTLTEKNSVLFQDNDFEIFIDPDGDHHNYYELEINALNTIWELTLVRPYRDGGPAESPTNVDGLRTAVHVDGTLNAPHDEDAGWSVEIAIPWKGLRRYTVGAIPPLDGDLWRFNFSRVQWQHEIDGNVYRKVPDTPENNWVWSPQGVVDMHRPERWGFVQFSRATPGEDVFRPDPTLPARDFLMGVYYAQKAHHKEHGRWADDPAELAIDERASRTVSHDFANVSLRLDGEGFRASVRVHGEDGRDAIVSVDHESRIAIETA